MYALVHKGKVIVGPKNWSRSFFINALLAVGKTNALIPLAPVEQLPYTIDEDTKIFEVKIVEANINPMVQYLQGPSWEITEELVIATYVAVDTPIESAKANFVNQASGERYKKEISGTKTEIQGTEVTVDTTREGRATFIQEYTAMADGATINWKFPEAWLTLTKAELSQVIAASTTHVQGAFNWEKTIVDQIQSATTAEQLLAIEIVEEIQRANRINRAE